MPYIGFSKPYNWPTHRQDHGLEGALEYLEKKMQKKLWACHRLDKTTSGVLLICDSKEETAKAEEAFRAHQIQKTYYFVSDRQSQKTEWRIQSEIEQKGKLWISRPGKNSETQFFLEKTEGKYSLWRAEPKTGKTHQIRLHAKDAGIPILGDTLYSGSPYPYLLLHSHKLSWAEQTFTSPLPIYMDNLSFLEKPYLIGLELALLQRQDLLNLNAFRLSHQEIEGLKIDLLGDRLWFQIFDEVNIKTSELEELHKYIEKRLGKTLRPVFQKMKNRGESPDSSSEAEEQVWRIEENGAQYLLKSKQGSSCGIFLDQRKNRLWVKENSNQKKVLNLFCYTGGFSICAALGGAQEIVSVDTSQNTLNWLKENIELNHLSPELHKVIKMDAREYLKWAKKKGLKFNLIVCDPPSFARTKGAAFKVEKETLDLIRSCLELLNPRGELLYFTNFEKWSQKDLENEFKNVKMGHLVRSTSSDIDYETPGSPRILKGLHIRMD